MTDLTQFGLEEPDEPSESEGDDSSRMNYRFGRCTAISTTARRRCRSPVSRRHVSEPVCAAHDRQYDPWTISDDPEMLVIVTGELDCLSLDDLEEGDVDFELELVRDALAAVDGEVSADD